MKTPDLEINNGYYVFRLVTEAVQFLQPADFPYGLLKNLAWNRITATQLSLQIIDIEARYICTTVALLIVTLALPSGVFIYSCCGAPGHDDDDHRLRRIITILVLDLLLILLPAGIVGMFISSEMFSEAVDKAQPSFQAALSDLDVFVRNTQLQIRFVATTSIDKAVDATVASLEQVEDLLGRPVQKELAMETGLDVALDALADISIASESVSSQIMALKMEVLTAREAAKVCQERMNELRRQVDATKKQCVDRDRNLCDSIDTGTLTIIFKADKLLADRKLAKLRQLGESNLTKAINEVRLEYESIPQKITKHTEEPREAIKKIIESQRNDIYEQIRALEEVSEYFTSAIHSLTPKSEQILDQLSEMEVWRRPIALSTAVIVLFIWTLLIFAVVFAGCGCDIRVASTLHVAIGLIATCILGLWAVASAGMFLGGNGDLFFCKPLHDDPNYVTLTMILDHPGLLYNNTGLFSSILKGKHSLDVPVKHILRECRLNQPAFPTFQLSRIFNAEASTKHITWPGLRSYLSNITVDIQTVVIAKPSLQKTLQELSQASRLNLTTYIAEVNTPTVEDDLGTFADNLEKVANQMTDLTTSARMETLASRARKLLTNNISKLEKHKEETVRRLAALEGQMIPLQRQANQSLSHLKTIQYYIGNQGMNISERKSGQYIATLVSFLERFRGHVLNELNYEVAPCGPIWDVFLLGRKLLCGNMVEPTVAFWVSTLMCLCLFFLITPLSVLLANDYVSLTNASLRRGLGELLLAEQAGWTSQQSTPESVTSPEQTVWTTPRRSSEQLLVPYRSSPELLRSTTRSGRERGTSPGEQHRESLRMIERVMPWARVLRTAGVPSPTRAWM